MTTAARRRARATTPRSAGATRSSQPIVADAERRVLQPRDRMAGGRRHGGMVQRRRRRPRPAPFPRRARRRRPRARRARRRATSAGASARGELGDRHGGERDQRDRRALREQPVREPARRARARGRAGRAAAARRRATGVATAASSASACGPPATTRRTTTPIAERDRRQRRRRPSRAVRASSPARQQDDRRLHRAQDGVRRGEAQGPGVSGRLRMPSVVWYFDHESWSAAISSSTKRGDALMRATTAPGTSPSSTSCSIRAKVSVNS